MVESVVCNISSLLVEMEKGCDKPLMSSVHNDMVEHYITGWDSKCHVKWQLKEESLYHVCN